MPAAGWKSVNLEEDVHKQLIYLSRELRRSATWTANRILEEAIQECLGGHIDDGAPTLRRDAAEKYDLL